MSSVDYGLMLNLKSFSFISCSWDFIWELIWTCSTFILRVLWWFYLSICFESFSCTTHLWTHWIQHEVGFCLMVRLFICYFGHALFWDIFLFVSTVYTILLWFCWDPSFLEPGKPLHSRVIRDLQVTIMTQIVRSAKHCSRLSFKPQLSWKKSVGSLGYHSTLLLAIWEALPS